MKKLKRTQINVDRSADVYPLVFKNSWELTCERGKKMDLSYLDKIDRGELIFQQLVKFANTNVKTRAIVNRISRYLMYVARLNGAVSARSLSDYKKMLDQETESEANTKYQVFSTCKGFVDKLMKSEVIETAKLPKGFKRTAKKPKSTIMEIGHKFIENHTADSQTEVLSLIEKYRIDSSAAKAHIYAGKVLNCIHEGSLDRLELYIEDCKLIDRYISNLNDEKIRLLSCVDDFRSDIFDPTLFGYKTRTIELALSILYAKHNYLIPSSTRWAKGLADFLKYHGWSTPRVKAGFFSNRYSLEFLLAASLSHSELSPNVDSVFFYSYLNTCEQSPNKGRLSFHFGKKRGGPSNNEVSSNDRLGKIYLFIQDRMKRILGKEPLGNKWLKMEDCPIFLHFHQWSGVDAITTFDPSLSVDFVRKVANTLSGKYSILSDIKDSLTGESFRPTITIMDVNTDTSTGAIQNKLGHDEFFTTKDYVFNNQTQSRLVSKQEDFQQFLISGARKLDYTGSGYKCGLEEEEDISCKGVNNCYKCVAKRIVIKDVNLIAEWLVYEEKILEEQHRLIFSNPERWQKYWLVKLSEYQILLSKCSEAEKLQAKKIKHKVFVPHLD